MCFLCAWCVKTLKHSPRDCLGAREYDKKKYHPGICGCGIPDRDMDRDGVIDCIDACPENAARSELINGSCGKFISHEILEKFYFHGMHGF